jgi:hypothetical protein
MIFLNKANQEIKEESDKESLMKSTSNSVLHRGSIDERLYQKISDQVGNPTLANNLITQSVSLQKKAPPSLNNIQYGQPNQNVPLQSPTSSSTKNIPIFASYDPIGKSPKALDQKNLFGSNIKTNQVNSSIGKNPVELASKANSNLKLNQLINSPQSSSINHTSNTNINNTQSSSLVNSLSGNNIYQNLGKSFNRKPEGLNDPSRTTQLKTNNLAMLGKMPLSLEKQLEKTSPKEANFVIQNGAGQVPLKQPSLKAPFNNSKETKK